MNSNKVDIAKGNEFPTKLEGINAYSDLVITLKEIFPELVQPKAGLPAYIVAKTEQERVQAAVKALWG